MGEHVRVRVLGRGAFGLAALYRRADGSLVVVKECDIGGVKRDAREKAVAESETLALLKHPNIVTYFDAFEDRSKFFIEMEYADAGNLRQLIEDRNGTLIPQQDVLFLAWQLFQGLAHVHSCGVLHRDIKSENIFMTSHGILKLGDFGISKVLSDSVHAETMVGTPYYMPPEMFKGQQYDGKCDVFSAGCVVHELCTLHRTFQATNMGAIMHRVMAQQYAPICDRTYSRELQSAITSMLEVDASVRPSAQEVLDSPIMQHHSSTFDAKLRRMLSIAELASGRTASSSSSSSSRLPSSSGVFVAKTTSLYVWGGGKAHSLMGTFSSTNAAHMLAIGSGHCAVCTVDMRVYTWSIGGAMSEVDGFSSGQLGHGNVASQRQPKLVEALSRLPCTQVACGEDFTFCLLSNGNLVAFGSNFNGCLGIGEDVDVEEDIAKFLLPDAVADSDLRQSAQTSARSSRAQVLSSLRDSGNATAEKGADVSYHHETGSTTSGIENTEKSHDEVASTAHGNRQQAVALRSGSNDGDDDDDNARDSLGASSDDDKGNADDGGGGGGNQPVTSNNIKSPFDDSGNAISPILVPFFKSMRVKQVACGESHVAVITEGRDMYTWGIGEYGKLGLGDEDDVFTPTKVHLHTLTAPEFVACGVDASAVVSSSGQLFVTGNNQYNKLCLNFNESVLSQRRRSSLAEKGVGKGHIRSCYNFTMVRWDVLRSGVARVSLGTNHMAALTVRGRVITCGCNSSGQLGTGDTRPRTSPVVVGKDLLGVKVESVACGDSFCIAATRDGALYGWGSAANHRLSSLAGDSPAPRVIPDITGVAQVVCEGPMTLCLTEAVQSSRRMAPLSSSSSRDPNKGDPSSLVGALAHGDTCNNSVFAASFDKDNEPDSTKHDDDGDDDNGGSIGNILPVDTADTFASESMLETNSTTTTTNSTGKMVQFRCNSPGMMMMMTTTTMMKMTMMTCHRGSLLNCRAK
ncbi:NEK/NEK8 protein kinase [Salpingoeca rosetta]|uniref:non-specific serine/threonine protein kinase n=1 Tax=Salpingoeca rosetta (strain ATCC 50818 / BSB-021) TaxID=946362 RepID=F2UJR6_SALR5|nr:NEK/NEK8 protein kinase [Salpingoeca rosetta]EGD77365.1 NEK/NEK8 protein kinase [Salpingoeca rosetta]|eukprot:XP_004990709.1 NEK/NEK8 protein kinase [Salpingoeca rosetta]